MEPTPPERRAGVARSVITGIAMGLREVFDPEKRDTVVIEQEAPPDPLEPQKVEVHLDADDPRESTAIYRPWLQDDSTATGPHEAGPPEPFSPEPEPPEPEPPEPEPPKKGSDPMFGFGF